MQDLDGLHEAARHGRMTVIVLKPEDAVGMLVEAAQQSQVHKGESSCLFMGQHPRPENCACFLLCQH